MAANPLEHVQDSQHWHIFDRLFGGWSPSLPEPIPGHPITKFMILELIAAFLIIVIFIPLCRRCKRAGCPRALSGTHSKRF